MKKIFLLVMAFMAVTNGFAQCACCAGAGAGAANGDYNNGILTLGKNQWVIETYTDYRTINQSNAVEDVTVPPTGDEEAPLKNMFIQTVGARYGLTKNITISALLPYVFLHTNNGNDSGLGDLDVMGTFTIFSQNNFNIALQAGVELPTGTQKNSAFDNTTVVVGSGSYDPVGGIVLSKRWKKLTLQANGLYKYTTPGFHGNYYGSIAIQNLTLNYKLKEGGSSCAPIKETPEEKQMAAPSNFGWSVFGGYYGEWLDHVREDDVTDENSGYYMGYATVGTGLSYKSWSFPITASLPIIQNMKGDQNSGGFRVRLGIIKSF